MNALDAGSRAARAAGLLLLSAVLVGTLWIVPYLPTNDGPEHILAVHIENHFRDPGTIYASVFRPAPEFAGRGFTVLYEPLEDLLGWQRGLQVALSIIVLLSAWGLVSLIGAVDPRRWPLAFLGFPLALPWTLYMGFFPFTLSCALGLFTLSFALRGTTPARRTLLAAMLLVQGFCHIFGAVLTGLAVAATILAQAPRGRRLAAVGAVVLVALPAASLAVTAAIVAHDSATRVAFHDVFDIIPIRDTLRSLPQTIAPGPLWRALIVTLLVACGLVFAAIRAGSRTTSPIDRALSVTAVLFLLISIFAPRSIPGWQLFSNRFISFGVTLLVASLPIERLTSSRAARGAAALTFAGALAWTATSYPFHRRLAASYADVIAGLSAPVTRKGSFLPVAFEVVPPPTAPFGQVEVPVSAPLLHIASLFAVVEGGLPPYTFATNGATWPFVLRDDAPFPGPVPSVEHYVSQLRRPEFWTDRAFRAHHVNELTLYGMFYDGVLLTGARAEDLAIWRRRGYVADWEQGSVMIGHFEPCRIDVALPEDLPASPAPLLDVGIDVSLAGPMFQDLLLPAARDAAGRSHLVVARGPCGQVWVRPHWDSPAATLGGSSRVAVCSNAGPTGEVAAMVTRARGTIECMGLRTEEHTP